MSAIGSAYPLAALVTLAIAGLGSMACSDLGGAHETWAESPTAEVSPGDEVGSPDGTGEDDGTNDAEPDDQDPSNIRWCAEASYAWVANTAEGTLSKVCTLDGVEIARYFSSPLLELGDPSRTSVNLYGDVVVANRDSHSGPSSVTKFAAEREDCVDRNGNGRIDTSAGPDDILPWGDDECMLWNTPLPDAAATRGIGARATAWDGTESSETGQGGHVLVGAMQTGQVFRLEGDAGAIVGETRVRNSPYGGAMDGRGNFWIVGQVCLRGRCELARVKVDTLEVDYFPVTCGYGIAVDGLDRVWTSGRSRQGGCVNRLDQDTGQNAVYESQVPEDFFRGIAVDDGGSVWVAETAGDVVRLDEEDLTLVHRLTVGPAPVVGVAIDFHGQVWAVSQGGNAAIRINPDSYGIESFEVGDGPYTYSDMTGYQLRTVVY